MTRYDHVVWEDDQLTATLVVLVAAAGVLTPIKAAPNRTAEPSVVAVPSIRGQGDACRLDHERREQQSGA